MFDKILFISIIIFVMIILLTYQVSLKTKDTKIFNIMIFSSLIAFWLPVQFFIGSGIGNGFNKWVMIFLPAIFQLTQAVIRVPLGILSAKLRSRKLIIQITFLPFLISITLMLATGLSLWSIFLCAFTSGIYGSTFGLQSQYWAENWNIKKAFSTTFIMLTIPMIAKSFSTIFGTMIKFESMHFKWMMMGVIIFSFVFFIFYSLIKENKETIKLDNNFKQKMFKNKKFSMKQTAVVSFLALIVAFVGPLSLSYLKLMNTSFAVTKESFNVLIPLMVIAGVGFTIYFLIPKFGIKMVKFLSISLMITGSLILFVSSLIKYNNPQTIGISIAMIIIGLAIFKATLFGIALHIDLKNPMLSLGIFLSFKSLSIGASTASSNAIVASGHAHASIIITSLIVAFILTTTAVTIVFNSTMKQIETTIVQYEFN